MTMSLQIGPGAGPHTTVFDFGSQVTLGSFLYRQRTGGIATADKVPSVTLTFSNDNVFAGDPSETITLDTSNPAPMVGYNLATPQSAQFVQAVWAAGTYNPGGAELDFNSAQHLANPSVVSASSEISGYSIGRLFDDSPLTDWAGVGGGPHTLVLDFGSNVEVDSFEFLQRTGGNPALDKFGDALLTFSDDLDFSDDTPILLSLAADADLNVYDLPSAQQGQFLEIVFGSSTGGNPGGAELDFFGNPNPTVPKPASIAIWSLLGLCLAGYSYRRRRRNS